MSSKPQRLLVAVGASWGGLAAIRAVLHALPGTFPAPVAVVQHRSPESHPTALRDLLGAATELAVCEAEDKQPLEPGRVYVAPAAFHLLVEDEHLELSVDAAVDFARPSIDVLFESAAESFRAGCVGVVLTGANSDGAAGLRRVAELGGRAIVQDPASCERVEMPAAAIAAVPAARVLPLEQIAPALVELCGGVEVGVR